MEASNIRKAKIFYVANIVGMCSHMPMLHLPAPGNGYDVPAMWRTGKNDKPPPFLIPTGLTSVGSFRLFILSGFLPEYIFIPKYRLPILENRKGRSHRTSKRHLSMDIWFIYKARNKRVSIEKRSPRETPSKSLLLKRKAGGS